MRCENCMYFILCSHQQDMRDFIFGKGNPHNWVQDDQQARKALSHIYQMYDDCKHYTKKEEELI